MCRLRSNGSVPRAFTSSLSLSIASFWPSRDRFSFSPRRAWEFGSFRGTVFRRASEAFQKPGAFSATRVAFLVALGALYTSGVSIYFRYCRFRLRLLALIPKRPRRKTSTHMSDFPARERWADAARNRTLGSFSPGNEQ